MSWARVAATNVVCFFAASGFAVEPTSRSVQFARDIRPILSDNCYECHGPDERMRSAELRLDDPDGLFRHKDRVAVVAPGDPAQSELFLRVTSADKAVRMPSDREPLSAQQIALLQAWIEQGAHWQPHWAFVRPEQPAIPAVQRDDWPQNEIDNFVLARLESAGIWPSELADKETLIRRVTLDLTGLPPSIGEIDEFLADNAPDAYERLVDRLLSSPRYGERMAADWLDAARYADTYGYQDDGERSMWRWRDWVIKAFNDNLPFDQFTIEQLAGDLLPNPTQGQRVATGFNRNHRANSEGGSIAEEFRVEYVVDRVDTTCTVWLGLTMGCARCHDHKFDPIAQREFYELYAFFNNVAEDGRARKNGNTRPWILAPTPAQRRQQRHFESELYSTSEDLAALEPQISAAQRAWELVALQADSYPASDFSVTRRLEAHYQFDGQLVDSQGKAQQVATRDGRPTYREGRIDEGLQLDGKYYVDGGDVGNFSDDDAFTLAAWVRPENRNGTMLSRLEIADDPKSEGYSLQLREGKLRLLIISQWLDDAIRLETRGPIQLDRWTHVAATYEGLALADGVKLYIDGVQQPVDVEIDSLYSGLSNDGPLRIGTGGGHASRFRGAIDDVRLYEAALTPSEVRLLAVPDSVAEILAMQPERRDGNQSHKLRQFFLANHAPPQVAELVQRNARIQRELAELVANFPTVMVMEERAHPRPTYILSRGQYDAPSEKVTPDVPDVLPALGKDAARNRLGLARWLVRPDHPLTARVMVNQLWQMSFGAGLVKTTENFGVQGEPPSHPELLDWLAVEFIRRDWDMKELRRLIVTSATYRQSSRMTPEMLERDPLNRMLTRGPRFRLSAEMIRDAALFASGLLVETLGGPSVRPYQPAGLWEELSDDEYQQDCGDSLYRRSLYTFWKRTVPHPAMSVFDAAGRETCLVREQRTNTPLQALVLMNEKGLIEAARKLAERVAAGSHADVPGNLAQAFRMVTGRRPSEVEQRLLMDSFLRHEQHFARLPNAARELLSVGETPVDPRVDKVQLAAYTSVANTLLNLDEAVTQH